MRALKKSFLALALSALAAFPAHAGEDQKSSQPQNGKPKAEVHGYLSTSFVSVYQPRLGLMIGSGPAHQNEASVSVSNVFREGDSASFGVWDTFDISDKAVHEYDILGSYSMGFKNGLNARVGYQRYAYPSGLLGDHDNFLDTAIGWKPEKIPLEIGIDATTLLTGPSAGGTLLFMRAAIKKELAGMKGYKLDFTNSVQYSHALGVFDFYGPEALRYDAELALSKGKYNLAFELRPQKGLGHFPGKPEKSIPSNLYWGISLSRRF